MQFKKKINSIVDCFKFYSNDLARKQSLLQISADVTSNISRLNPYLWNITDCI